MSILQIFENPQIIQKIKTKLPQFIHDMNVIFSRDGKLSPDIGTIREKMIIGILKKEFGNDLQNNLPAQETEADFILFSERISLKTSLTKSFKLIWTANYEMGMRFYETFQPTCSILLLLFQTSIGGVYYFPLNALKEVRTQLDHDFLNKPKSGTNPRGVSLSTSAFNLLANHSDTNKILVDWQNIDDKISTGIDIVKHYYDLW